MTESNDKPRTIFAGVYFDRDSVLRLARLAEIFAWVSLVYYAGQAAIALTIFILQVVRGLMNLPGLTDYVQQFLWIFQPALPGLWNFIGLQAVGKVLLIFMDMEDNTRRAANLVSMGFTKSPDKNS
jgi:MFS superfamily sulfate permease-like transporter